MRRLLQVTHHADHFSSITPYVNELDLIYKEPLQKRGEDFKVPTDMVDRLVSFLTLCGYDFQTVDKRPQSQLPCPAKAKDQITSEILRLHSQMQDYRTGVILANDDDAILRLMTGLSKLYGTSMKLRLMSSFLDSFDEKQEKKARSLKNLAFVSSDSSRRIPQKSILFTTHDVVFPKSYHNCSRFYTICTSRQYELTYDTSIRRQIIFATDDWDYAHRRVYMKRWHSIRSRAPSPLLDSDPSWLELKRKAIWHHHQRNLFISRLAIQLRSREWKEELRVQGLFLTNQWGKSTVPSVLVLVESTEHAMAISQYLPNWGINDPSLHSWDVQGSCKQSIVTLRHYDKIQPHCSILIRATGHYGPITTASSVTIVDVIEDRSTEERVVLQKRLAEYFKLNAIVTLPSLL